MILVSRLYFGFLGALILCVSMISQAFAVPLENALDKGQAKNDLGMHRPWDEAPPVYYDLNPHMTDGYNEPHPLPAYINRDTYNQLLNIEPVNQVQSRVFNPKLFEALQRIGILGFEVMVVFKRKGKRVKFKKAKRGSIPGRQNVTKEEIKKFLESKLDLEIVEKHGN